MKVYIKDITYYLPDTVLTNEQISVAFPEWTTDKIAQKVGISERHIAAPNETTSDMAVKAAERLFAKGYDRNKIDFVLLCTQSPDYMLPSSACIVQHRLGLSINCGAFDFNLGCSGYAYGLVVAKSLILSNIAHNVLLLTSEMYTKYLSENDKGNRTIFSDGASATLIGTAGFAEIGQSTLGTDGSGADFLIKRPNESLYMDGGAIFNFSSDVVPQMVTDVLFKSSLKKEDVNLWVFHQANKYMINYIRKLLDIDKERFYIYMEHVGNTVSSTIPIALCAAREEGKVKGNIMLAGFGVGLSWGAVLLKCE